MSEVFKVKNPHGVNSVEVKDFGLIIPATATIELGSFDKAVASAELIALLGAGTLQRVIDGTVVSVADSLNRYIEKSIVKGSPKTYERSDEVSTFRGKSDIGTPGDGQGLDVGEGGSYQADPDGTVVVKAYKYDASAGSGSRFTELDINAENTLLGDAGDRIYIGSPYKFWAARFAIGVAKTAEVLEAYYWNGSLTQFSYMGMLKESVSSLLTAVMEQTIEKEYIAFDKVLESDWAAIDNQLDEIPNAGSALYWICLQVPAGGLTTPPRVDEIKVRGSDMDVKSGVPVIAYWGRCRPEQHDRLAGDVFKAAAGTPLETVVFTSTQQQVLYKMRSTLNDVIQYKWKIPHGLDTSCKVRFSLDYVADQAISTADIALDLFKIKNGVDIGVGESSDVTQTTNITVVAGDKIYTEIDLTAGGLVDISSLADDEVVLIQIKRTDSNGGNFYPLGLVVHFVVWTTGQHV